jgi:glycosyltransferase involved in cell wall biosynthesis
VGSRLKEKYDVPLIITGHGYDVYSLPFLNDNWNKLIVTTLNSADHIITVSNKNKEILESLKIRTPMTMIPNGYKKDLFYPMNQEICRTQLGIPLNKKVLLTVGNLVEIKGHKYLIDALKLLKKTRNDFICYIVGEGKLRTSLQKQIQQNELDENIKLVGYVDHEKIPIWMNAADLFILPSLNEGNPTVLPEALGCGKPFVGTRVGGVPEIITSDDYGLLVEPADPEDLAEKILAALDRGWDREAILAYAERYTWENIAKEIMGVYEQVLG